MRVFLTCYGGAHVSAIIPLYQALVRRGHTCDLLALTTAAETARRCNLPFYRPIDFVDIADADILEWGERLAQRHHTEGKGLSRDESIAYLGVSFCDLAADIGEAEAWRRYEKSGLNAFAPVRFMRRVIAQFEPDVVVATTSPRMEKAALRAAFQLDVPSLCMVELFGLLEEPWLSRPDNGHVLAVSREDVRRRLVAAGRQACDIHLTGSPMFDQLADPDLPAAGRRWRHEHGVADSEKLVFWAEQPEPGDPELPRRVRLHLADLCRRKGWRLVVRLHPSSTDHRAEKIPSDCLQSHAHEPLSHVMHACDAGVTLTSTVGWELLLCNKPLLVIRISEFSNAVTYGSDDGALVVDTLEQAAGGLSDLLHDTTESARLQQFRSRLPSPGGASHRICDLIEKTVFARNYSLEDMRRARSHAN